MDSEHHRQYGAEENPPGEWQHSHPHSHRNPRAHEGLLPSWVSEDGDHRHSHPAPGADIRVPDHEHTLKSSDDSADNDGAAHE